jgi:hypothetical protein
MQGSEPEGLQSGRLQPCQQILDKGGNDLSGKQPRLLQNRVTYDRKKFYSVGPRMLFFKRSLLEKLFFLSHIRFMNFKTFYGYNQSRYLR